VPLFVCRCQTTIFRQLSSGVGRQLPFEAISFVAPTDTLRPLSFLDTLGGRQFSQDGCGLGGSSALMGGQSNLEVTSLVTHSKFLAPGDWRRLLA
jgi:hypothetical protein